MNFRRHRQTSEPEINLIPFIDVLLVVLIFLMLTTTYNRYTQLQLRLPVASTEPLREQPKEVHLSVTSDGHYAVNRRPLADRQAPALAEALREAARAGGPETVVVLSADANARHQWVVTAMEAARLAGLNRVTFASQTAGQGANPSSASQGTRP